MAKREGRDKMSDGKISLQEDYGDLLLEVNARVLTPELRAQAKLAVRDEYIFDFLELGEAHSERELERGIRWTDGGFFARDGRDVCVCGQSVSVGSGWGRVFCGFVVVSSAIAKGIEGAVAVASGDCSAVGDSVGV